MPAFELSKWYADCASDQGDAAIVYHAELRWRALRIHYASLLTRRAGEEARAVYTLRKQQEPAIRDDEIAWESPAWNASGRWTKLGSSQRNLLFSSEAGSLEWTCIAPRATARLTIGAESAIEGWGYVEHLRLTVAPWRLPIRRLRWGRFVNAADSLVWIDWNGPYNKTAVYLNGSEASAHQIGDGEVALESGAVLSLDRGTVLREGALGATALHAIANLDRIFPNSVLNMHECKWLSSAVLSRPGQPDSTGMAIHEVVEWP